MTGTPGLFELKDGDFASCHITNLYTLSNEII